MERKVAARSLVNRLSSHSIIGNAPSTVVKGSRRVSGVNRVLRAHSSVGLTGAGSNRGVGQAANSNSGSGGALGGGIAGDGRKT